jgi:hypothetical protein
MNNDESWLDKLKLPADRRQQLLAFLEFIDGPITATPKSLLGVCEVYIQLVELGDFNRFPPQAKNHIGIAQYLLDGQQVITEIEPLLDLRRDINASTALHGLFSDYPSYCLLYYLSAGSKLSFMRLQQALLVAIHNPGGLGQDIRKSDISSYCLGMRKLTDKEDCRDWLSKQDRHKLNSVSKIQAWIETGAAAKQSAIKQIYQNAHRLLDVLVGEPVKRISRTKSHRSFLGRNSLGIRGVSSIGSSVLCEPLVLGDIDDQLEYPAVNRLYVKAETVDSAEIKALGVEPNEVLSRFEFLFTEPQQLPAYAQGFSAKIKAAGAIKAIERQNQFLPCHSQGLTDQDLTELGRLSGSITTEYKKDLLYLLYIMLVTGSSLARARSIEIFHNNESIELGEDKIGFDIQTNCWILPAYQPQFATSIDDSIRADCRKSDSKYLHLPEPINSKLTKHIQSEWLPNNKLKPYDKKKNLEKKLKGMLSSTGTRLTLSRIERCLILHVAGRNEATVATYLFNNYLPSSSARSYYTVLNQSYYQKVYKEARYWLNTKLNLGGTRSVIFSKLPAQEEISFGARYCPTTEHVAEVIEKINVRMGTLGRDFREKDCGWIEYHNEYTASMVYLQGFLTAIRSVIDPFVGISQIIEPLGIAVFRDKDGEDQFHTRTIPLHDLAIKLAKNYRAHRHQVLMRLYLLRPISAKALKVTGSNNPPETFLLDDSGRWQDVRPSLIKPYLSRHTNLPLNSNRKYLRTRLLEMKLQPHAIDTLLGHAARGEPFWSSASTLEFKLIADDVIEKLDEIITEIKIPDLKGLTC